MMQGGYSRDMEETSTRQNVIMLKKNMKTTESIDSSIFHQQLYIYI